MWLVAFGHNAFAHEVRPAYLEFRQTGPEVYDVPWKVPALGEDARLAIYIELPEGTHDVAAPRSTFNGGAFFERRSIRRDGGLNGHSIAIEGLSATATDVLVRIESLDGATQTERLSPTKTSFVVQAVPSRWEVAATYLRLGIEHILLGYDHLLFVLALVDFGSDVAAGRPYRDGLHRCAQHHPRSSDARHRQRARPTGGGCHRAQHRAGRCRDC